MKFILTNLATGEEQSVTRECVDRVKGSLYIDTLIERARRTGEAIEVHFEGDYDLKLCAGII